MKSLSCVWLFATPWTVAHSPWDSPGKNTGVGCRALFQGIFLTQGIKLTSILSPALADGFFTWEPQRIHTYLYLSFQRKWRTRYPAYSFACWNPDDLTVLSQTPFPLVRLYAYLQEDMLPLSFQIASHFILFSRSSSYFTWHYCNVCKSLITFS